MDGQALRVLLPMRLTKTSDLWWKNAVVYCLDVETYSDGDGDGVGDFRGLIEQIDHLHRLGVTCLWLMPFYPSPDRDDGYDITDFYGVDPRLGTLGDFVEFVRTARDRGIRVIVDLVVNHTSARSTRGSSRPAAPATPPTATATSGPTSRLPTVHRASPSPTRRPASGSSTTRRASTTCTASTSSSRTSTSTTPRCATRSRAIIGFWMQLGVSGFRVDAVPFLLENDGPADAR